MGNLLYNIVVISICGNCVFRFATPEGGSQAEMYRVLVE